MAFCPSTRRLICRDCAVRRQVVPWPGGPAPSHLVITCPECGGEHPGLDAAEAGGLHPFDLEPGWEEDRHGLSDELALEASPRWRPRAGGDEASVRRRWSDLALSWHARQGERGDPLSRRVVNPVLYELLGNVLGVRILDAGAGDGYQSRLLAKAGARVVAVESSPSMLELARAEETEQPTGVDYREGSLTRLPVETASQQVVIAAGVLDEVEDLPAAFAELRRVLVSGGLALVTVTHPVLSAPLASPVAVAGPAADDCRALLVGGYGVEGAYAPDPDAVPPRPTFHRTVEHYVRAARAAGFAIDTLREPLPPAADGDPAFPPALILGLHAGTVPWPAGDGGGSPRSRPTGCGIAFLVVGGIVLVTAILAGIGIIVMR